MNESTIKALEEFHKEYKAKVKAEVRARNKDLSKGKDTPTLKPWDSISGELRSEFMILANHAIVAEHHKEGFIKSDEAVMYSAWANFKSSKGIK
jgi:hypothetical protein